VKRRACRRRRVRPTRHPHLEHVRVREAAGVALLCLSPPLSSAPAGVPAMGSGLSGVATRQAFCN
jgi:hypothetical protein